MDERNGWRGALETAWGNLTGINNEGNIRIIRMLFFLVFVLGTVLGARNYSHSLQLMNLEAFPVTPGPNQADTDKKRLDAMIQQVETISQLRAGSPDTVKFIEENLAKYPFRETKMEAEELFTEDDLFAPIPPVVVVDYPPEITLRGIMIIGKQNVAVVDISGVGTGIIVRSGDTFMQKKGRVVRIAPDKLVVNWGGENWDIAPSF